MSGASKQIVGKSQAGATTLSGDRLQELSEIVQNAEVTRPAFKGSAAPVAGQMSAGPIGARA